jgi:formiminoglutamase
MKDLSIYFTPIDVEGDFHPQSIGNQIETYTNNAFPELKNKGIALFFVPEYRGDNQIEKRTSNSGFRESLYALNIGLDWGFQLYDLGDITPGKELKDTYFAISQTVEELVKNNIIPIVVGGSQDLTFAVYKGYEALEQMVNICAVDYKFDLGDPNEDMHSDGFLSHLLLQRPCYLFNLSTIGTQAPFISHAELELYEKLYFDQCRLGEFNADFKRAEPHLRNADILSIDMHAIRSAEWGHSTSFIQPNGFYADQICQISKYAGMSDKLTSIGVFNYNNDQDSMAYASTLSQIIWYFVDGVAQRKGDFPVGSKKEYTRFTVHLDDFKDEIIFYKSNKSHRWWMEVPYPAQKNSKYQRHFMVPCDEEDYHKAMKNELPDLWWKTFQKLS